MSRFDNEKKDNLIKISRERLAIIIGGWFSIGVIVAVLVMLP